MSCTVIGLKSYDQQTYVSVQLCQYSYGLVPYLYLYLVSVTVGEKFGKVKLYLL